MNTAGGSFICARDLSSGPRSRLYKAAAAGEVESLGGGVFFRSAHAGQRSISPYWKQVAATALIHSNAVLVSRTAALFHGLATPTYTWREQEKQPFELGFFNKMARVNCRLNDYPLRIRRLYSPDHTQISTVRWEHGTIRAISIAETCAQLARWWSLEEAVVAAESALFQQHVRWDQVESRFLVRRKGVEQTRKSLNLITPWSESPRETELKLALWKAGLPAPDQQVSVWDGDGRFLGRVDFLYRCGVIVEYDGADKHRQQIFDIDGDYQGEESLRAERERERRLINAGFSVVRVDRAAFRDGSGVRAVAKELEHARRWPRRVEGCRVSAKGKAWREKRDGDYVRVVRAS